MDELEQVQLFKVAVPTLYCTVSGMETNANPTASSHQISPQASRFHEAATTKQQFVPALLI